MRHVEPHVDVVAGAAMMPKVKTRWVWAHKGDKTPKDKTERSAPSLHADLRAIKGPSLMRYRSWQWRPGNTNTNPQHLPRPSVKAAHRDLLVSLGLDGGVPLDHAKTAFLREKCWSWKKPALAEMEVIEAYKQIPVGAIESALAKLSVIDRSLIVKKFGQPMTTPALARFRQQSYAKTLPAMYRAVKRLQRAAELINHDNVVMIFTPVKRRAAA
jgi:hypothetical protein